MNPNEVKEYADPIDKLIEDYPSAVSYTHLTLPTSP
jgi:hypothetical protein